MTELRINIDVETKSTADLRKTSAKMYARHPSTDIIVVRYCDEATPDYVYEWLCYQDPMPLALRAWLLDPSVRLVAHNAGFEHAILTSPHLVEKYDIPEIEMWRWDDTAARAARMALPRSLDGAGKALGLDVQKDLEGSRIMLQLCKPRSWAVSDDGEDIPVWWTPEENADKYEKLSDYCATDVRVGAKLSEVTRPMTDQERAIWLLTEEINETGVFVDWEFAEVAVRVAKLYKKYLDMQMFAVTEGAVAGASKVVHLKQWCAKKGFVIYEDDEDLALGDGDPKMLMDKGAITQLLARDDLPGDVRTALSIRRVAAKNSVAKYESILNRVDRENSRVYDTIIYHGASTGRWAGAGIQTQNFPRATVKDWVECKCDVMLVDQGVMTFEQFEEKHGQDLMAVLSKMLRGTICAPKGGGLVACDFSSVEARGVAWVAGATDLVDLFASGGKVYEEFAGRIYGVPASSIGKDSIERFLAKTAVLGCGYGMGGKKFVSSCEAQGKTVSEEDGTTTVQAYRSAYPEIPALWRGLEGSAIEATRNPGTAFHYHARGGVKISFFSNGDMLMMKLPSGRSLYYHSPRVIAVSTKFGTKDALQYSTVNSVTRKWQREVTWGGRLAENAVQAICRDLMAEAMLRVRAAGYTLVMTVHDELVVELTEMQMKTPDYHKSYINKIMTWVPKWAAGFPVGAEAGFGLRYSDAK
jgi:DNA polymerase